MEPSSCPLKSFDSNLFIEQTQLTANVVLETYQKLNEAVKSKSFCLRTFTNLPNGLATTPEHFKSLFAATEVFLGEKDSCLYFIENGYLGLMKQLFMENLTPCAMIGIVNQLRCLTAMLKFREARLAFFSPPEDNIFQALLLLLNTPEVIANTDSNNNIAQSAKNLLISFATHIGDGEFDFLIPLREEKNRNEVFEILKSSHIFYQVDFHESIEKEKDPLRYLQTKDEGLSMNDIPLVFKTSNGLFDANDILAMTDNQIYTFLPIYCTYYRTISYRCYDELRKNKVFLGAVKEINKAGREKGNTSSSAGSSSSSFSASNSARLKNRLSSGNKETSSLDETAELKSAPSKRKKGFEKKLVGGFKFTKYSKKTTADSTPTEVTTEYTETVAEEIQEAYPIDLSSLNTTTPTSTLQAATNSNTTFLRNDSDKTSPTKKELLSPRAPMSPMSPRSNEARLSFDSNLRQLPLEVVTSALKSPTLVFKYVFKTFPAFISALLSRVYRSPMLSNLLAWLEGTGVGFAMPDKVLRYTEFLMGIRIVTLSQIRQDTFTFYDYLASNLSSLKAGDNFVNLAIICPTERKGRETVVSATVKKVFASKARPILLHFKYHESFNIPPSNLIFKTGNSLTDMYSSMMMQIFNIIWRLTPVDDKHKAYLETYTVLPLGYFKKGKEVFTGIEMINAVSLEEFDWKELEHLFEDKDRAYKFLRSAVGSYCFAHVMMLRDRHKDNMMIKLDEKGQPEAFLQIDFEFILSDDKILAPTLAIQPGFEKLLRKTGYWKEFIYMFCDAFIQIHRNAGQIITYSYYLFSKIPLGIEVVLGGSGEKRDDYVPDLLSTTLMVNVPELKIRDLLTSTLESASKSLGMAVNNVFHTEMVSFLKKYNKKTNEPKDAENIINIPGQSVAGTIRESMCMPSTSDRDSGGDSGAVQLPPSTITNTTTTTDCSSPSRSTSERSHTSKKHGKHEKDIASTIPESDALGDTADQCPVVCDDSYKVTCSSSVAVLPSKITKSSNLISSSATLPRLDADELLKQEKKEKIAQKLSELKNIIRELEDEFNAL